MGITRADLIRSGRDLDSSDAEWAKELTIRQQVINRYMANDTWATKIKLPVLVLLISHSSARCYLTASVETHKKLGYWLAVCYDNFIAPEQHFVNYNAYMPSKDVMDNIDTFMINHYQTWGGVLYPFIWSFKMSAGIAQHFEYVYCVNGDCIIEKPEGFPKMLELLGDNDLMSSGPVLEREIGTAGLLMKSSAFLKIANHLIEHLVPFEVYEKYTQDYGNTEGRLSVAVKELGLKQTIVSEPPFNEQHHKPGGTWYNIIGFRHIHGEHNYAYRYKDIPPELKYFDKRFMGDEYNLIKRYWETKDIKILESWWAK